MENRVETFLNDRISLYAGDCLDVLDTLAENSIDSCVCDPPYHLTSIVKRFGADNAAPAQHGKDGLYARASKGFMGKQWDGGDVAFRPGTWAKVLRVLKPGAHLLAFSGTRTYHRMATAIEDAGFEIRDMSSWLYGSGFPKSHNLKDEWEGWGTALKPACEPICFARKPLSESTIAANVLKWGTGALNIDGCRVGTDEMQATSSNGILISDNGSMAGGNYGRVAAGTKVGRWPANVLHDGSEEVIAAFPETKSGELLAHHKKSGKGLSGTSTFQIRDRTGEAASVFGDSGSAARFFYGSKADSDDRIGSKHPTVKPVDLMQWLCRLITPPRGTVLDCFAGTGTTGEAAWREGFNAVLIEREEEYRKDIARRMTLCIAGPNERSRESIKAALGDAPQSPGPLFAEPKPASQPASQICAWPEQMQVLRRSKSGRTIGPIGLKR